MSYIQYIQCGDDDYVCDNCVYCLKKRIEVLEKMVTALWYAPGNPGALEAKELHESRVKK